MKYTAEMTAIGIWEQNELFVISRKIGDLMPDHVHCFVEVPPTMSVSKALNLLKGYSSYKLFQKHRWLRAYFRKGHLWSPGKFFRSVGNVTAEAIKNYIAQSNRAALNQQSLNRYSAL